jgi:hypothetical protein
VIEFVVTLLGAIALLALVGMKVRRMIDDPKQRELIGLLLTAGQNYWDDPATAVARIRAYFRAQGWNNVEILWRMAHAVARRPQPTRDPVPRWIGCGHVLANIPQSRHSLEGCPLLSAHTGHSKHMASTEWPP